MLADLVALSAGGDKDSLVAIVGRKVAGEICRLYERAQKEDFLGGFYRSAIESDQIQLPSLTGKGTTNCSKSFYLDEGCFIYFEDGELSFYVVQVRRFFDGIYLPSFGLFVGRHLSSVVGQVKKFASKLNECRGVVDTYLSGCNKSSRFLGGMVCQRLPYHYFYDVMPGVHHALQAVSQPNKKLLTIKGASYLNLEKFYDLSVEEFVIDRNKLFYVAEGFFISLLRNDLYDRKLVHVELDRHLANTVKIDKKNNPRLVLDGNRPVVWLGVMAGKRAWLEQCEALSALIELTIDYYGKPFFIFDGLTAPVGQSLRSGIHDDLIDRIVDSCKTRFSYINLNGAGSSEKLYFASLCDFFICDAATSSMYVARMLNVPGVAYSVPQAKITGHIHRNTNFYPSQKIAALASGRSWDYTDFSIDPKDFACFVMGDMARRIK